MMPYQMFWILYGLAIIVGAIFGARAGWRAGKEYHRKKYPLIEEIESRHKVFKMPEEWDDLVKELRES
jgi:hypothetical protein